MEETIEKADRVTQEQPKTVVEEIEKVECPECGQLYDENDIRPVLVGEEGSELWDTRIQVQAGKEMCASCVESRFGGEIDESGVRGVKKYFDRDDDTDNISVDEVHEWADWASDIGLAATFFGIPVVFAVLGVLGGLGIISGVTFMWAMAMYVVTALTVTILTLQVWDMTM